MWQRHNQNGFAKYYWSGMVDEGSDAAKSLLGIWKTKEHGGGGGKPPLYVE